MSGDKYWSETLSILKDDANDLIAVLRMYCYTLPLKDHRFLVWYSYADPTNKVSYIKLSLINADRLEPLTDILKIRVYMKENSINFFQQNAEILSVMIPSSFAEGSHDFTFPNELKELDELLIVAGSTAARCNGKPTSCIFALRPSQDLVDVYPQDWFNNNENTDLGYQWITRVARDPESGKVFGEGFRINHFRLDNSLRQLEHLYDSRPYYRQHSD